MPRLYNSRGGSLAARTVGRFLRFGVLRGLRSIEIDPEDFRRELSDKHGLWVPDFSRMKDVPVEHLDAIAKQLIRDAERLALLAEVPRVFLHQKTLQLINYGNLGAYGASRKAG